MSDVLRLFAVEHNTLCARRHRSKGLNTHSTYQNYAAKFRQKENQQKGKENIAISVAGTVDVLIALAWGWNYQWHWNGWNWSELYVENGIYFAYFLLCFVDVSTWIISFACGRWILYIIVMWFPFFLVPFFLFLFLLTVKVQELYPWMTAKCKKHMITMKQLYRTLNHITSCFLEIWTVSHRFNNNNNNNSGRNRNGPRSMTMLILVLKSGLVKYSRTMAAWMTC